MIVRKMRLERGWSQEQLAELAGVSVRTIQRVERGRTASLESLKCLAAVFETDINILQPEAEMTAKSSEETVELPAEERAAMEYVRDLKSFQAHLFSYLVIMPLLAVLNYFTSPENIWAIWPALGWGAGVLMHGLVVYEVLGFRGQNWEREQIKKRLSRS